MLPVEVQDKIQNLVSEIGNRMDSMVSSPTTGGTVRYKPVCNWIFLKELNLIILIINSITLILFVFL